MEELPDGARGVTVDGRRLKLTNWTKVLYPQAGFTKGDLIEFYARIAPVLVPHLHDRPLTLKRYPSGVEAQHFYEKQSPSHRPEWVQTAEISEINFTLAQDRPTLVWLAGLADIELHTSLALARSAGASDERRVRSRPGRPGRHRPVLRGRAVLRGLFSQLGLESLVKTSGSKGMQLYLPLNSPVGYEQTKTVRQADRRAAGGADAGARGEPDDQADSRRQGVRRLEPERLPQDDGERLLGARARAADRVDPAALGGGRGGAPGRRCAPP